MRRAVICAVLSSMATVSACGIGASSTSESNPPVVVQDSSAPAATNSPTTVPPTRIGWTDVDTRNLPSELAERTWKSVGCCLEGYSGDVASPDFPADGGIADGEYYAYLKDFDPADPTKAVFRVVQIDDCANPDMRNIAECYDIVGPGMRFEIGSESRDIEVALDENLWIVVMSNAENPAVSTDATFRSLFGDGHSLSDLLQVVRADFDELVHPLIESGATLDEVSTALNFDGSPFGYVPFPESNGGYGMVRWYREGYPPLSYSEGSSDQPDILTPKYYDDATSSLYVSDFDRFIRNGGSFELKDGVIAFTYAWEFGGG